jgi:hypothetical protein
MKARIMREEQKSANFLTYPYIVVENVPDRFLEEPDSYTQAPGGREVHIAFFYKYIHDCLPLF